MTKSEGFNEAAAIAAEIQHRIRQYAVLASCFNEAAAIAAEILERVVR